MQPCLHLRATPLTPRRPSGPRTCRRITCRASAGQEPGKPSPNDTNIASTAEKPTYNDSWTDILFIALCRQAYGNLSGWQSPRGWLDGPETFKGMVEVSRSLMRGRTAAEQYNAVIAGFPAVPDWFRRVFPYRYVPQATQHTPYIPPIRYSPYFSFDDAANGEPS